MKLLVVGGGGREHAIIRSLKKNPEVTEIFACPGNGGMAADATCVNIGATDIEKIVATRGLQELITDIRIPTETVTEVKDNGQTKEVERKVFPGYVLIKMVVTEVTWFIVRNTRGVTGFVGPGSKPVPLTDAEVAALGVEKHSIEVNYKVGDRVTIIDGPLEGFSGVVDVLEPEKNNVNVVISMFGRETPVELELDQVALED